MTQKLILADSIEKFCRNIDQKSSAVQYARRLNNFDFLRENYNVRIDEFLASFIVNSNPFDVYDVSRYRISLGETIQPNTMAARIKTVRHFLELMMF